ncbi:MAG: GNAT family N-acetyltransferase [Helicobacteraceae bacterium]|jgi:ribosomal-protein-alanine N-acetyltransferase|nr:GNAT family N-acetyltransferase [Helicobacteraceae bacterium]
MKIRQALSSDCAKLYALENELFSMENFPLSRRSFYYHINHNLLYVAVTDDGDIAGYVLALVRRRDPKLYSLGVAKTYRGGGVAGMLMKRVFKELTSRGFKRTLLEVRCDNTRAIALYRTFGFSLIKELNAFYRDGCDAYLMEATHA